MMPEVISCEIDDHRIYVRGRVREGEGQGEGERVIMRTTRERVVGCSSSPGVCD